MKIINIAIMGAGAVGGYMLWGLSQKKDINVCVIADGERRARLEKDGLHINNEQYFPTVKTPAEAEGTDLLIVALKYNALRPSLDDIGQIVDDHTIVMSVMNGVDSEEIIAEHIGEEHLVYSVMKVASHRNGNRTAFDPETTIGIIYGERCLERGNERINAITELFTGTELHFRESDVIMSEIWTKFRLNTGLNLGQAMIGCGRGAYRDSEHAAFIRDKLTEEVDAIAAAKGIDLSLADKTSLSGSKVADSARYSTLQDLDAGRHTEIDMFSGAVVRMGEELGIPTPYSEMTYHLIKALEEKNDGMFDYE